MIIYSHHKLQGVSHKDKGVVCQDSFAYKDIGWAVVSAVADGVSACVHSDFGSKVASEISVSYCAGNLQPDMKDDDILGVIYQSFDQAWHAIENGARERKFDVSQCHTTLTLVIFTKGNAYYGHVGDSGFFAFFEDGKIEPVTSPQNDKEDRVYTLFSQNMWVFEKVSKKAVSLLLCTDGIWKMFQPSRLADNKQGKHSVPLLAWYIDPDAIKEHSKNENLQKWLESDMREINTKNPTGVNYDDISIVIIYDDKVRYKRQQESYYALPSKAELERAAEEEHKRLYGHLDEKREKEKSLTINKELPLEKACEYDMTYRLTIRDRAILVLYIFKSISKKNTRLGFIKNDIFLYPVDIFIDMKKIEAAFGKTWRKGNDTYYRIINYSAKLLTNGLSIFQSSDTQSIVYRFYENSQGFKELLLSKDLSNFFRISYFNYKESKEAAILPTPDKWINALKQYIATLKNSNCLKEGHFVQKSQSDICPWCKVDEAYSKLKQ